VGKGVGAGAWAGVGGRSAFGGDGAAVWGAGDFRQPGPVEFHGQRLRTLWGTGIPGFSKQ